MKRIILSLVAMVVATMSIAQSQTHSTGASDSKSLSRTFNVKGVSFTMVYVEGGTFTMGAAPNQESDAFEDEKPTHRVTLDSYLIGETEVTQELWEAVLGYNYSFEKGRKLPVDQVSWNQCRTFIYRLNAITGLEFRFPTEAEWEFAARGGNKSKGYKYSGGDYIEDIAWFSDNSGNTYHQVKTMEPNELGIYDMTGNVQEWCQDFYGAYSSSPQTNPKGPSRGSLRVIRGGHMNTNLKGCRTSYRHQTSADAGSTGNGLRLALSNAESKPSVATSNTENLKADGKEVFNVNGVFFKMIPVEGKTFTMGATSEQSNVSPDSREKPTHRVVLSSYLIGETEVTQELWKAVMGNSPSFFGGNTRPVEQVSWYDCQLFLRKLNTLTGKKFRLPTEAEWEFAARGGSKTQSYIFSGSNDLSDVAWFGYNSEDATHPVKMKAPNELGIYDMCGNVWEWCQDWYGDYNNIPETNPKGPISGSGHVLRGGSWINDAWTCRKTFRSNSQSNEKSYCYGFRLALSIDETY